MTGDTDWTHVFVVTRVTTAPRGELLELEKIKHMKWQTHKLDRYAECGPKLHRVQNHLRPAEYLNP